MTEHTVKSYGEELAHLTAEVTRMGGLVESQVADCIVTIARRDGPLAQAVVAGDERLDILQAEIERKAFKLIALRQPMAVDLRHAVAALKISMSLERCGDMAKNIAKRALILTEADPMTALTRSIERMGRLVQSRLKDVLDAYTTSDLQRAIGVWSRDEEVDEVYNSHLPRDC
jgi:phosphate transport system protein